MKMCKKLKISKKSPAERYKIKCSIRPQLTVDTNVTNTALPEERELILVDIYQDLYVYEGRS